VHGKKKSVKNLVDGRTTTVMISDIEQQNGGLAINLTEKAISKLQVRSVKTGKSGKDSRIMVAEDFEIEAGASNVSSSSASRGAAAASSKIDPFAVQLASIESMWKQKLLTDKEYQQAKVVLLQKAQAAEAAQAAEPPPAPEDSGPSRPPVAGGRRTTRAPPTSGPTTKVVVKSNTKGRDGEEEDEESEEEEEEEEEEKEEEMVLTEKQIQEALLEMGQCSQGYDWNERDKIEPCQADGCGASGVVGWQCGGGSHWMCRGCVVKHAKKNKGKK
jgi:hypothetical protein